MFKFSNMSVLYCPQPLGSGRFQSSTLFGAIPSVPNLSLTSELGATGAVAPVSIARGPSLRVGCPQLLLHFLNFHLKHVIFQTPSLCCIDMNPIPGEFQMVSHPQCVLEIHESQLAGIGPHQIAGHVIPSGHIAVHEIRHWSAHIRFFRSCAQHHESRSVRFLQFIQKADQQGLPSAFWGNRALKILLVPSIITNVSS